jgi:hypothetical protein
MGFSKRFFNDGAYQNRALSLNLHMLSLLPTKVSREFRIS